MWFHHDVDVSAWMLYELHSPSYAGALALSTGRFFDASGRLVASVSQESLLRRQGDPVDPALPQLRAAR